MSQAAFLRSSPIFGSGAARARLRIAAIALAATAAIAGPAWAQYGVPSGFQDQLVIAGLSQPVGIAFIPDGRMLIIEQVTARVRLVVNDALSGTDPLLTVPNVKTTGFEQGLLGIAVDPDWPARPYIYVFYDYSGSATIRISRFTVAGDLSFTGDGDLTVDPGTRYDILTDPPDDAPNHNGGTLRFGPDGMLYASLGDDANACLAQSLTALAGKILRLDVSGLPAGSGGPPNKADITPADNPYVTNANANAKLVAYLGLRNPFRFGIDLTTGDVVIGDVGLNDEEEVDWVETLGNNFEWPHFEGNEPGPQTCAGADVSQFTGPIYSYPHPQGAAVVASVVYRAPLGATYPFPAAYEGDIFVSDFYASFLRRLNNDGGGSWSVSHWATGPTQVSDWVVAPDGSLSYCAMGAGAIRRIRYTDTTGVPPGPPVAAAEFRTPFPSPSNGPVFFDFALPAEAAVDLTVFDATGRRIRGVIEAERRPAGPQQVTWDGRDERGQPVAAGVYMARLVAGAERLERRFVVAR